jgi:hypothetical protein
MEFITSIANSDYQVIRLSPNLNFAFNLIKKWIIRAKFKYS